MQGATGVCQNDSHGVGCVHGMVHGSTAAFAIVPQHLAVAVKSQVGTSLAVTMVWTRTVGSRDLDEQEMEVPDESYGLTENHFAGSK